MDGSLLSRSRAHCVVFFIVIFSNSLHCVAREDISFKEYNIHCTPPIFHLRKGTSRHDYIRIIYYIRATDADHSS